MTGNWAQPGSPFFCAGAVNEANQPQTREVIQRNVTRLTVQPLAFAPRCADVAASSMSAPSLAPHDLQHQLARVSDHQAPLVIDVRRRRQFHRARIAGSHNIPAGRLLSSDYPDRDLILIGARAGDAEAVAEALHQCGFHRRIQHLEGGVAAWEQAGLSLDNDRQDAADRSAIWSQRRPWLVSVGVLGLGLAAQQADPALLLRASLLWLLLGLLGVALHRGSRELLRRSA